MNILESLVMNILGIVMILISVALIGLQIYANIKQKHIDKIKKLINTPLDDYKNIELKEASILGAGTMGLSFLDIYSSIDKHEEVLNVLEERFPIELSKFNSIDWFNKISELIDKGENAKNSYISAFKGQQAENLALELLRERGLKAELFEELNHPNDDIRIVLSDGTEESISIKCGSSDYIKQSIESHPESNKYIINTEAYEEFDNEGLIEYYNNKGISIENGMYYDEDLSNQAINAIDDIGDNDIADNIPFISIGILLIKSGINICKYNKNEQTKYELKINLAVDSARAVTGGTLAVAGAKTFGTIGGYISPGLGNIIGGGIGTIVGGFVGGKMFNFIKDRFKWGDIIDSIEYYGEKYKNNISENMKFNMCIEFFDIDIISVQKKINDEMRITKNYKKSLNPYSMEKISVSTVLSMEYISKLDRQVKKMNETIKQTQEDIYKAINHIIEESEITNSKKKKKITFRYFGEIILSNSWMLDNENLNGYEKNLLNKYKNKIEVAENHPYRINDSYNFIKTLAYRNFNDIKVNKNIEELSDYKWGIYLLSFIFLIVGINLLF